MASTGCKVKRGVARISPGINVSTLVNKIRNDFGSVARDSFMKWGVTKNTSSVVESIKKDFRLYSGNEVLHEKRIYDVMYIRRRRVVQKKTRRGSSTFIFSIFPS